MKLSQIMAIVCTLVVSIGVVVWLANSVPEVAFDDSASATSDQIRSLLKDTPDENEVGVETGVHQTNPFEISEQGPHPKAVLEETVFDFGVMAVGESGAHDFVVRNTGEAPLKLAKGVVQCKCTVSGLQNDEIPPGGEASIRLEYTPRQTGIFGQGAAIWTNDPTQPKLEIRVEGMLVPELMIEPANGWVLGTIPKGRVRKLEGFIASGLEESFEITAVETSSDAVSLTYHPVDENELAAREMMSGYELLAEYRAPDEAGPIREQVTLKTTLKAQPEVVFTISGSRSGPVVIVGPGWTAGNQTLNLDRIDFEQGLKRRLTVLIEPFDQELEIQDLEVSPPFLQVNLERADSGESATRLRYILDVEVPPQSPKGQWIGDNLGQIVFRTNHPQLEEVLINVKMMIQ